MWMRRERLWGFEGRRRDKIQNYTEHRLKPVLPVKLDETQMAFRGV
jgi:hypothetical protein